MTGTPTADPLLARVKAASPHGHWDVEDIAVLIHDAQTLAAEVERLRARPCPWVETSDGGTSHCTLAAAIGGHVCEVCGQLPVDHAEVDGIWPTPCCAGCPCGTYPTADPAPTGDQP